MLQCILGFCFLGSPKPHLELFLESYSKMGVSQKKDHSLFLDYSDFPNFLSPKNTAKNKTRFHVGLPRMPTLSFNSHQLPEKSTISAISELPQHCCEQYFRNSFSVYSEEKIFHNIALFSISHPSRVPIVVTEQGGRDQTMRKLEMWVSTCE